MAQNVPDRSCNVRLQAGVSAPSTIRWSFHVPESVWPMSAALSREHIAWNVPSSSGPKHVKNSPQSLSVATPSSTDDPLLTQYTGFATEQSLTPENFPELIAEHSKFCHRRQKEI